VESEIEVDAKAVSVLRKRGANGKGSVMEIFLNDRTKPVCVSILHHICTNATYSRGHFTFHRLHLADFVALFELAYTLNRTCSEDQITGSRFLASKSVDGGANGSFVQLCLKIFRFCIFVHICSHAPNIVG
jgi:hypothetical protein